MLDLDKMIDEARRQKRDRENAAKILTERLTEIEAEMKGTLVPLLHILRVDIRRNDRAVIAKLTTSKTGQVDAAIAITPLAARYKLEARFGEHKTTATAVGKLPVDQAVGQLMWSVRDQLFHLIEFAL